MMRPIRNGKAFAKKKRDNFDFGMGFGKEGMREVISTLQCQKVVYSSPKSISQKELPCPILSTHTRRPLSMSSLSFRHTMLIAFPKFPVEKE